MLQCQACTTCTIDARSCQHSSDVGINCYPNGTECNDGDLRLIGGANIREGRVEVCIYGLWGSICGYHVLPMTNSISSVFNDIDAMVACQQLGFSSEGASTTLSENSILSVAPIFLDDVQCNGEESKLLDCPHSGINEHHCEPHAVATIACQAEENQNLMTNNVSLIAGLTSGVLALIGVVIMIVATVTSLFTYHRHCYRKQNQHSSRETGDNTLNKDEVHTHRLNYMRMSRLHQSRILINRTNMVDDILSEIPEELLILSGDLRLLDTLGQGEYGIVYKAHLLKPLTRDRPDRVGKQLNQRISSTSLLNFNPLSPTFVAVKTLKDCFSDDEMKELIQESVRMHRFDHHNVLCLIGICLDAGPAPYIVLPFMSNGSLLSYLKKERSTLIIHQNDEDLIFSTQKRLNDMCLQIAKGMEYLTKMKVIHRDLAARNCMIDCNWMIKVADFGLSESIIGSKDYFRQNQDSSVQKLPIKWMAPESLHDGIFSEKTDVWSFGVTCWEVFSGGKSPYPGMHPTEVVQLLEDGKRMDKPRNAGCSDRMYKVMGSCWEADPSERPPFTELVVSITQTMESLTDYLDVNTLQNPPSNSGISLDVIIKNSEAELIKT